jgi:rhamnogalacturonyl hydrolase YesR
MAGQLDSEELFNWALSCQKKQMKKTSDTILFSLKRLEKWIEIHNYKGYDPADGLTSFLRPLTFGNLFLDRLLQQFVWRFPINIRPIVGVKPLDSCIGRGYMASGYLTMLKVTGNESYRKKAISCLEWLMENKAPGFEHYSWGKMFDFASRGGRQSKNEPITVWSSLIGQAFLDAYEIIGIEKYLHVAESICIWILERPRNKTKSGSCINYTAFGEGNCTIHNQSMLAAAMLARTAKFNGNLEYRKVAKEAIAYTCTRQLSGGAWRYGEEKKYHWIDNFHTGYNLDALKCYIESSGDKTFEDNLIRGFDFFKNNFFESTGRPKYYYNRTYPIDSQCASQAIETLTNFSAHDGSSLQLALKVAKWTIENMQDPKGYFYFMRYPFITLKVSMIHWAQATTYKAMANLLLKLFENNL